MGKCSVLHLAHHSRLDPRICTIITTWDCGTQSLYFVIQGQYFLLKILTYFLLKILTLPLCYQRYRVHVQFLHISQVTFSSSLSAQIFRDNSINEVSEIKCKNLHICKVISIESFTFQKSYLYYKEATILNW